MCLREGVLNLIRCLLEALVKPNNRLASPSHRRRIDSLIPSIKGQQLELTNMFRGGLNKLHCRLKRCDSMIVPRLLIQDFLLGSA